MSAVIAEPQKRLHLPIKVLGDNFYPFMYGVYRDRRMRAMARARVATGHSRSAFVKEARELNRDCLWYLYRIERSSP
jgi:hypothetical protein